ncbi:MAG: tripartite tricarboxylate transporter permease [Rhizobiaceae bacterium]
MMPTRKEIKVSIMPMLRGTAVGSIFGPLPGTGPTVASFLSYALEKRVARDPSRFGKGAIEGICSPEASNNAAVQTAFIPTLALGIPGSATMAIMLGALMIHGITPGPRLITEHSDLFWGVVASFWIGNLFLMLLNIPLIGVWVSLLRIPYSLLYPAILTLICIGVYSIRYSAFDIVMVAALGVLGYLMRLARFEPAPLLIGFILGPMIEQNFRRAMLIFGGDFMPFIQRPISGLLLGVAVLLILMISYSNLRSVIRSVTAQTRRAR